MCITWVCRPANNDDGGLLNQGDSLWLTDTCKVTVG